MKKIPFVILLLCVYLSDAQNYRCLQPDVRRYFVNANGYIRGIRVDSVRTFTDSAVYYLFRTPRGPYDPWGSIQLDSNGGSWLGRKVVELNDGTFLFSNIWHGTIVIKSRANVGDSWIFYSDSTDLYYEANVVAIDTMTVMGMPDSVKKIRIAARRATGIDTLDPVNNFQIILSKNSGFEQLFDLCTFPYHKPDSAYTLGIDYYLDMVCSFVPPGIPPNGSPPSSTNSIFSLIYNWNPTNTQLYKWDTGDVFVYFECYDPNISLYCTETHIDSDAITAKYINGGNVVFRFSGPINSYNPIGAFYHADSGFTKLVMNNNLLFDTTWMPEEDYQSNIYYFYSQDSSFCMKSPKYEIVPNYINYTDFYNAPYFFEGPTTDHIYKIGLGQVYYRYWFADINFWIEECDLTYYKKDSLQCPAPDTTHDTTSATINLERSPKLLKVFPNPASRDILIQSSEIIRNIEVTTMLGQMIFSKGYNDKRAQIDITGLAPGMYLMKINGTEVREIIKE